MDHKKHTPGPWEVSIGDNYAITAEAYPKVYPHHYKSDDLGGYLAFVGNRAEDFGLANARLIAATPNLLEACEYAERVLNNIGLAYEGKIEQRRAVESALGVLRAAITKATKVAA